MMSQPKGNDHTECIAALSESAMPDGTLADAVFRRLALENRKACWAMTSTPA